MGKGRRWWRTRYNDQRADTGFLGNKSKGGSIVHVSGLKEEERRRRDRWRWRKGEEERDEEEGKEGRREDGEEEGRRE